MNKVYSRIVWENFPSEKTALNERNLNRMDLAIDNLDDRVIQMDSTKVNVETANTMIKNWSMDEETGVITVEKLNGEKILFDLNIEKIPVDFKLSEDGILTMTTDDGTQYTANIGAMIPVLTFEDSDTIAVSVTATGVNKTYSFSVKAGSVTEDKLQPNFLADVKTEVAKAQASQTSAAQSASASSNSATLAESYTHGGTGAREGEDADNARYYMEQAKAVSAVNVATTETAGIVKPDGDTITVDPDGTIHGQSKVSEMTGATAEANGTSGTVPAPKAGQQAHILGGDGTWKSPLDNEIIAAKIEELNKSIEDAIALRASLEAYGMVKVTNSSAVTDSTGLALAATEKNASIDGTLANQISQLNTDLENKYNRAISAVCFQHKGSASIKIRISNCIFDEGWSAICHESPYGNDRYVFLLDWTKSKVTLTNIVGNAVLSSYVFAEDLSYVDVTITTTWGWHYLLLHTTEAGMYIKNID